MDKISERNEKTRKLLIKHYENYPKLQSDDLFKYIFQSAFGCEHLVSSEDTALEYIKREYEILFKTESSYVEKLDGEYSRVYLSCLNEGLRLETLAKLFCLSAKKEPDAGVLLKQKLEVIKVLVENGEIPLDSNDFSEKFEKWCNAGNPAIRHSDEFRTAYSPAYRVVSNLYVDFLDVFLRIDRLISEGNTIVAIEGGSASGKTTLAGILKDVYDCNVFHMDDFFLRPEQRTAERFAEIGGNVDRERFFDEVLQSLTNREKVIYRRFDCSTQTLGEPITVEEKKLTVIEGAYSMHPMFSHYYDLSVFLDVDPECQRKRILIRNSPNFAQRFFYEWIPLENRYFDGTDIRKRADLVIRIND